MTIMQARQEFIAENKTAYFQIWKYDKPALREAGGIYTDALCRDGRITQRQYDTWTCPFKEAK